MFRFALGLIVLFALAAQSQAQQCNSGVSTQQAQIAANEALVLKQQAANEALRQAAIRQPQPQFQPRITTFAPQPQPQFVAAPACTTCQQAQTVQRPIPQVTQPSYVLTGSNSPAPPGRYVVANPPVNSTVSLARN